MGILTTQHALTINVVKQIVTPSSQPQHVCVHGHEHSSSSNIWVGAGNLTSSNGYHLDPGQNLHLDLNPGDDLYALTDSDNVYIHTLVLKQD